VKNQKNRGFPIFLKFIVIFKYSSLIGLDRIPSNRTGKSQRLSTQITFILMMSFHPVCGIFGAKYHYVLSVFSKLGNYFKN
jgi:hypothetical protein